MSYQYENEVTTAFDFVIFYTKMWKMYCDKVCTKLSLKKYIATARFLSEIEMMAYDFTKSVLVDAEVMSYKPSLIVAALITISIELSLK